MRFYNLNIRHFEKNNRAAARVSHARKWLCERRRAPIFFGGTTVEQMLNGTEGQLLPRGATTEGREFCRLGLDPDRWRRTVIATIDDGMVWLYRPNGPVEARIDEEYAPDVPKSFPIDLLECKRISDVPLVLASMKVNQAFSRGTFHEVNLNWRDANVRDHIANALAMCAVAGLAWEDPLPEDFADLDCISSLELETLVAKLLESCGLFVPAYRGGCMAGIDLVATNDSDDEVNRSGLLIPARSSRSIQVKRRVDGNPERARYPANFLLTLQEIDEAPHVFGRSWLRHELNRPDAASVRAWLRRCAAWSDRVRAMRS